MLALGLERDLGLRLRWWTRADRRWGLRLGCWHTQALVPDVYAIGRASDMRFQSRKFSCLLVRPLYSQDQTYLQASHVRSRGSILTAFCSRRSITFSLKAVAATGGRLATLLFMLYLCQSVEKCVLCSDASSNATLHDIQVNIVCMMGKM